MRHPCTKPVVAAMAAAIATICLDSANAAVVLRVDFDRMAVEADRVVVGSVTAVRARWSADGGTIETVIDVAVEEDLSGISSDGVVRIVQPGGIVGDVGLAVPGMPQFRQGERVLLFLRAGYVDGFGDAYHRVFGMAQGKFRILPRLGGGFDAVQDLGDGLALAGVDADGQIRPIDSAPLTIDLGEAIERIRRVRGTVTP